MQITNGDVAVITGAGSGIGRALALHAGSLGMRVVAADIEAPNLDETVALITDAGGTAISVQTDVSVPEAVEALAAAAFDTFGDVHLLCNNAGVFSGGFLWERTLADWNWVMGVNLYGIVHAINSFVPRMIASGHPAHIVNTASMGGLITNGYSGPYYTSKFAAVGVSECLAHDLRGAGTEIGVSVLVPSLIATSIGSSDRNRPERWIDRNRERGADEEFVVAALTDSTAGGMPPAEVADIVFGAVAHDQFWIPTKPSYHDQIRSRHEAMQELQLPPGPPID
jgi:NAD(P)-dependent dehydrogenase (short-subunit alcohol dehydrogenase family)